MLGVIFRNSCDKPAALEARLHLEWYPRFTWMPFCLSSALCLYRLITNSSQFLRKLDLRTTWSDEKAGGGRVLVKPLHSIMCLQVVSRRRARLRC